MTLGMVAYFLIGPVAVLMVGSLRGPSDLLPFEDGAYWTLANYRAFVADDGLFRQVLPNTLIFASAVTILALCVGALMAWLTVRLRRAVQLPVAGLILIPMLIPSPIFASAWVWAFAPNTGFANTWLDSWNASRDVAPVFSSFGLHAMITAQAVASIPFAWLLLRPVLSTNIREYEEAASASGASPWRVGYAIRSPLLSMNLLLPVLFLLITSLEQVDLPYLLGTPVGVEVFGTRLLAEFRTPSGLPNLGGASVASLVFIAGALAVLKGVESLIDQRPIVSEQSMSGRIASQSWARRFLSVLAIAVTAVYLALGAALPIACAVWQSLGGSWGEQGAGLSLRAFNDLFRSARFTLALRNTVIIAVSAASVSTLVAVFVVTMRYWASARLARSAKFLAGATVGVPSPVIAAACGATFLLFPNPIYGSTLILCIACSYRTALATHIIGGGVASIDRDLIDTAACSGSSSAQTFRRVIVPAVAPAMGACFGILMVAAIREFTIPLFLSGPNSIVLSVLLMELRQAGLQAQAGVVGLIVVVVNFVLLALTAWCVSRIRNVS